MAPQEGFSLRDIPVATLRPNGSTVSIYYIHTDQLNTPREVTRPSDNTAMWTWNADPFGTDAANPNPAGAGTFAYNLRFPGQLFDGQAGIHQNYLRGFDPALARYIESDLLGLYAGSFSTYTYGYDSPMSMTDPTGLESIPLGQGYSGRVDSFPSSTGQASFEIHVTKDGVEYGVYGPNGWINKHGFSGRPTGIPDQVENSCKGVAIERMRAMGVLPKKGRMNIKGNRWMRKILGWLPLFEMYYEDTRPSIDRTCEMDPAFDGC